MVNDSNSDTSYIPDITLFDARRWCTREARLFKTLLRISARRNRAKIPISKRNDPELKYMQPKRTAKGAMR